MFKKITLLAIATLSSLSLSAQSEEESKLLIRRESDELVEVQTTSDVRAGRDEDGVPIQIDSNIEKQRQLREEHRMNRGMIAMDEVFLPAGQWIAGATASYSTHVNDNYTFTLIEGINSEGYSVNASPFVLYSYKDNKAVGGRFLYGRSLTRIYDANFSIGSGDDGVEIVVNDFYGLTNSYTAMAVFRQYIPFGNVKRFAFFTDISLEGGGFQTKYAHDYPVKGTFSTGYTFGVGLTPGIVAFATNDVAFEVSIAIAGASFTHSEQVHNQVYSGYVDSANFNFKLSLLSVGFGVSFYL